MLRVNFGWLMILVLHLDLMIDDICFLVVLVDFVICVALICVLGL